MPRGPTAASAPAAAAVDKPSSSSKPATVPADKPSSSSKPATVPADKPSSSSKPAATADKPTPPAAAALPPQQQPDLHAHAKRVQRKYGTDATREAWTQDICGVAGLSPEDYGKQLQCQGHDVYVMAYAEEKVIMCGVTSMKLFWMSVKLFKKVRTTG